MAALIPIPNGEARPLSEAEPLVFRSGGQARFVVARHRSRWLVFDVSGTTRVDAQAVEGGALSLSYAALITAGADRLRLVEGGPQATVVRREAGGLCSHCREPVEAQEAAASCSCCGRLQHIECARESSACGRCQQPLRMGEP